MFMELFRTTAESEKTIAKPALTMASSLLVNATAQPVILGAAGDTRAQPVILGGQRHRRRRLRARRNREYQCEYKRNHGVFGNRRPVRITGLLSVPEPSPVWKRCRRRHREISLPSIIAAPPTDILLKL